MHIVPILIAGLLLLGTPCFANPKTVHQKPKQSMTLEETARFSPAERHLIRTYLTEQNRQTRNEKARNLPYGLQKKVARGKALPPGWQQKVVIGRSLDYQIYRYGLPLPQDLLTKLPPGPTGSQIIQVEDNIIRMNTTTRKVLDIFNLIQSSY